MLTNLETRIWDIERSICRSAPLYKLIQKCDFFLKYLGQKYMGGQCFSHSTWIMKLKCQFQISDTFLWVTYFPLSLEGHREITQTTDYCHNFELPTIAKNSTAEETTHVGWMIERSQATDCLETSVPASCPKERSPSASHWSGKAISDIT